MQDSPYGENPEPTGAPEKPEQTLSAAGDDHSVPERAISNGETPFQSESSGSSEMEAPALSPMGQESPQPFYSRNPLTLSFSILLVLIYGLTTFNTEFKGPSELIVAIGGFYPPAVAAGEWWRFITATLLHGNPGHLINNVAGLLIFGNLLEPVIGSRKLFVLYVISALTGLGLSFYMLPQGMTFGASTIDYGLIGTYIALVLVLRYRYDRAAFFREFRGAIMFVLLFVGWNSMESATVNLWGHIGGLLGGIGFALWVVSRPKIRPFTKH